jgi:hypothetical protein
MRKTSLDRLSTFAARLAALDPQQHEHVGLVSVTVAAIYAIRKALSFGSSGSPGDLTRRGHVLKAGEALARGETPPRVYLAGYYFNDSLVRVDIAYENILRHRTRRRGNENSKTLIDLAVKTGWDAEQFGAWKLIRDEINGLKHRNPEQIARRTSGRGVEVETVLAALASLLPLIEAVVRRR